MSEKFYGVKITDDTDLVYYTEVAVKQDLMLYSCKICQKCTIFLKTILTSVTSSHTLIGGDFLPQVVENQNHKAFFIY